MASRNKKTTMAKLARESRLRTRRLDKQARKEARKRASSLADASPFDTPALDGAPVPEPPTPPLDQP